MIKLENVTKTFPGKTGDVQAVKELSLEIQEGELCIFLGPSGCGKTTSLKMINRLIPMTSGKISVNGVDTMDVNPNELRRGIGYAIQNIGLFPHLTVGENIATVPMLRNWSKEKQRFRAEELLDLVGMDPAMFIDRYPSELSGGQQQRVGVARSLGADPPILLMDEPFGAIDPITRSKLQDEFLKIQGQIKKTIVFVTHDIEEAIKMGDKVALMKEGELVQFDDPANLLYNPANDFVRDFVGSDHLLRGLRLHKVKEIMKDPALKVRQGSDPLQVKEEMRKKNLRYSMLVDAQDHFIGWIRRGDVVENEPLREIIEPPVVFAEPETQLNEALSMMLHSALGNLAVLDERQRLVGVLDFQTIRDVLESRIDEGNSNGNGEKEEGAES